MLNDILVICHLSSNIDRLYYLNFALTLSYVHGNIMNECNLFHLEQILKNMDIHYKVHCTHACKQCTYSLEIL